jgi:hypothetical protein
MKTHNAGRIPDIAKALAGAECPLTTDQWAGMYQQLWALNERLAAENERLAEQNERLNASLMLFADKHFRN